MASEIPNQSIEFSDNHSPPASTGRNDSAKTGKYVTFWLVILFMISRLKIHITYFLSGFTDLLVKAVKG